MTIDHAERFFEAHGRTAEEGREVGLAILRDRGIEPSDEHEDEASGFPDVEAAAERNRNDARDLWKTPGEVAPARTSARATEHDHGREDAADEDGFPDVNDAAERSRNDAREAWRT